MDVWRHTGAVGGLWCARRWSREEELLGRVKLPAYCRRRCCCLWSSTGHSREADADAHCLFVRCRLKKWSTVAVAAASDRSFDFGRDRGYIVLDHWWINKGLTILPDVLKWVVVTFTHICEAFFHGVADFKWIYNKKIKDLVKSGFVCGLSVKSGMMDDPKEWYSLVNCPLIVRKISAIVNLISSCVYAFGGITAQPRDKMFKNNTSDLNIKYLKLEITNCLMEIEYRKMDYLKSQLHSTKLPDLLKIRLSNEIL